MKTFVDVGEGDWFYNEVMEATNFRIEDDDLFIHGIPYSNFVTGQPYLYEELAGESGKTLFSLSKLVVPTEDNPLFVYIDGVQTIFKSLSTNTDSKTDVLFYTAPRAGSIVSFASLGKPSVDKFGKPSMGAGTAYPQFILAHASEYYFDPFSRKFQEYLYAFGRKLKRLDVPTSAWDSVAESSVIASYISDQTDVYIMSPTNVLYLPYNVNGVTCRFVYTSKNSGGSVISHTETFKPASPTGKVQYINRFFPSALITRAEAFHLIDKLRRMLYQRFTDVEAPGAEFTEEHTAYDGQRVFKLDHRYSKGEGILKVYLNGSETPLTLGVHYTEFDDQTVLFTVPLTVGDEVKIEQLKYASTKFKDVGYDKKMYVLAEDREVSLGGLDHNTWWVKSVLDMEEEKFGNGDPLISGFDVTLRDDGRVVVDTWYNPLPGEQAPERWFLPSTLLTRAQAVTFLNHFRKWSIERFKK